MKKFGKSLYAVALSALVLASCGKEPVQTPGGPDGKLEVVFGSNIISKPTAVSRVNNNAWGNLDGIGIYMLNSGMQLGDVGAIVESNENRYYQVRTELGDATKGKITPFDYSNIIYYPLTAPSGNLKFVSYYPYIENVEDYTLDVDINDNTPLLTAVVDNQPWYNYQGAVQPTPIDMEFKHKMARIKINMTPGEGFTFADLSDVNVTFRNGNTTGSFSLVDNAFDGSTVEVGEAQFSIVSDIETQTATAYLVMIPNSDDINDRVLIFEHPNFTGGGATSPLESGILASTHFEEGMEYTYDAELNRGIVNVEAGAITEWTFQGDLAGDDLPPKPDPDLEMLEQSLELPNTYIWPAGETTLTIPVTKAFGMWLYDGYMGNENNTNVLNYAVEPYLIWADSSLIEFYTIEYDEPYEGAYLGNIVITYDAVRGNAASHTGQQLPLNIFVGMRNLQREGTIMLWSWHVWITDGDPAADWETRKNFNGAYTYYFMDRNLGAKNPTPGDPGAKGLLYELARKDPFLGTTGWEAGGDKSTKMWYYLDGNLTTRSTPNGVILADGNNPWSSPAGPAENPLYFARKTWWNNTFGESNAVGLWGYAGSEKSNYDPCPEGWRVPGSTTLRGHSVSDSPWYNSAIGDGSKDIFVFNSTGRADSDYGVIFDGTGSSMGGVDGGYTLGYYPFGGFRNFEGNTENFNNHTRLWYSSGGFMKIEGNNINGTQSRDNTDYVNSIRCAKWVAGQQ